MDLIAKLVENQQLGLKDFNKINIDDWNALLISKDESFWQEKGKMMALKLFQRTARYVPAYKDFLRKHRIKPEKIKTYKDFKHLPSVNKKNYLRKYPLEMLCEKGILDDMGTISVSSGSTGEPFFWPRGTFQELDTTLTHELFLKHIFSIDKYSTLLIVAYSMGMYVAGPFTFSSSQRVGLKGYPLTVVTPGINKIDVVRVIKNLSPSFEQTILAGYPPFVKDVLDASEEEGVNLSKLKLKFIFGAESFSEEWREYMLSRVAKDTFYRASMNTYGSADAAILGHETPFSIFIRRTAARHKRVNRQLFQDERLPSLHQYNPILRFFEMGIEDQLIVTVHGGIPLIRYNIGDNGGILSFKEVISLLRGKEREINEFRKGKHTQNSLWRLPLVYLFARKDFTVTLYGLNIYPENIKAALLKREIRKFLTGKFVMSQEYDKQHNQYLQIRLELKRGIKPRMNLVRLTQQKIIRTLQEKNREYNRLYEAVKDKARPKVLLEKFGDRRYFSEGVKQRWVK